MAKWRETVRSCIVLLLVAGVGFGVYWFFLRPKTPNIEFETTHIQMGRISNKAPTSTKIAFFNRGRGRLKIESVNTSCSCTSASAYPPELTPGDRGTLSVAIDPAKFGGFESEKIVTVSSNDKTAKIRVSFLIDPEFEVKPDRLDLGEVTKGVETAVTVRMRQLGEEPIAVKDLVPYVTAAPGLFALTYSEVPADQRTSPGKAEFDLRIAVPPDAPTGPFQTYVGVVAPCSRLREYWIPASGKVVGPYEIDPHVVLLGRRRHGDVVPGIVRIGASDPVTVTDIVSAIPAVSIACTAGTVPNAVQFDARIDKAVEANVYEGLVGFVVHVADKAFRDSVQLRVRVIEPDSEAAK